VHPHTTKFCASCNRWRPFLQQICLVCGWHVNDGSPSQPDTEPDPPVSPARREAAILLDQNALHVVATLRRALPLPDVPTLYAALELEKSGKNRVTVIRELTKALGK